MAKRKQLRAVHYLIALGAGWFCFLNFRSLVYRALGWDVLQDAADAAPRLFITSLSGIALAILIPLLLLHYFSFDR